MAPKDYDAVLLASFGGPEGQDDVIPFLRNVTRGRGIPDERLEEVSHHYRANGGISPINEQNRALQGRTARPSSPPRHRPAGALGQPQLGPLPRRRLQDSVRRRAPPGAGMVTQRLLRLLQLPAVPRGLRHGAGRDRARRQARSRQGPPVLRPPGLRRAVHRGHRRRRCRRPRRAGRAGTADAPVHICSPRTPSRIGDAETPVRLRRRTARVRRRAAPTWRSTWPSAPRSSAGWRPRSGAPPPGPWSTSPAPAPRTCRGWSRTSTTPSRSSPRQGVKGVVIVPLGFVSDHMEVVWDLDTEALETCARARPGRSPGPDARHAPQVRRRPRGPDLRADRRRSNIADRPHLTGLGPWYDVCRPGCCANFRGEKPTIAGADTTVGTGHDPYPAGPGRPPRSGGAGRGTPVTRPDRHPRQRAGPHPDPADRGPAGRRRRLPGRTRPHPDRGRCPQGLAVPDGRHRRLRRRPARRPAAGRVRRRRAFAQGPAHRAGPRPDLAATPKRVDVRDVLCARDGLKLADLPPGRRSAPAPRAAPPSCAPPARTWTSVDIRGNVDTRLGRVPGLPGNSRRRGRRQDAATSTPSCSPPPACTGSAGSTLSASTSGPTSCCPPPGRVPWRSNAAAPTRRARPVHGARRACWRRPSRPSTSGHPAGRHGRTGAAGPAGGRLRAPVGACAYGRAACCLEAVVCAVDGSGCAPRQKGTDGLTEVGATLWASSSRKSCSASGAADIAEPGWPPDQACMRQ